MRVDARIIAAVLVIVILFVVWQVLPQAETPEGGAALEEEAESVDNNTEDAASPPETQEPIAPENTSTPAPPPPEAVNVSFPTPEPANGTIPTPSLTPTPTPPNVTAPAGPYIPSCSNQRWDGDESDLDCGGSCAPCPNTGITTACWENSDCATGNCDMRKAQALPAIGPSGTQYNSTTQMRALAGQVWIIPYQGICV